MSRTTDCKVAFRYGYRRDAAGYGRTYVKGNRHVHTVISPHGLGEYVRDIDTPEGSVPGFDAFLIDANSGDVLQVAVDVSKFGVIPSTFDVRGYRQYYGYDETPQEPTRAIYSGDIAYTLPDGRVVMPTAEYREWQMREYYLLARDHIRKLVTTTAAFLPVTRSVSAAHRHGRDAALDARAFLHDAPGRRSVEPDNDERKIGLFL